ncbi:MAG: hypothetical protein HQ472_01465 [Ignavibacteria bacterium]|nr:hypothetical protein [Ignavibacteria bacterium]
MIFEEVQGPPKTAKRLLMWVALINLCFVAGVIAITQLDANTADPSACWVVGAIFIITLWLGVLFMRSKMYITVSSADIRVRMSPFHRKGKLIKWADVHHCVVRACTPFGEFGGWGIRYTFGKKKGYIWNGDYCLDLYMKNGKRNIVTVMDADDLAEFLTKAELPFEDKCEK